MKIPLLARIRSGIDAAKRYHQFGIACWILSVCVVLITPSRVADSAGPVFINVIIYACLYPLAAIVAAWIDGKKIETNRTEI